MTTNDIKTATKPILKKHGVIRAALFGSVTRNEQTNGSDIDFVVEFEDGRSLFDLGGLKIELEELLHTSVDVVTYDSLHPILKGSIVSYHELVAAEKAILQKGMNFGVGKNYSVFLMSVRPGAPYADAIDPKTGMLTYEGHDVNRTKECPDPKLIDQPLATPRGSWTENGKFFRAAMDYKGGLRKKPHAHPSALYF